MDFIFEEEEQQHVIIDDESGGESSVEDEEEEVDEEEAFDEDNTDEEEDDDDEEDEEEAHFHSTRRREASSSTAASPAAVAEGPLRFRVGWEISNSTCFESRKDVPSGGQQRLLNHAFLTLSYEPELPENETELSGCSDLETFCAEVLPSWKDSLQACEIQLDTDSRFANTQERYYNDPSAQWQYYQGLAVLGKAFGTKLPHLCFLRFVPHEYTWTGSEDDERLNFDAVAAIVQHIPQIQQLDVSEYFLFESENVVGYQANELHAFARAIHNHPSLKELAFDCILLNYNNHSTTTIKQDHNDNTILQNALLSIPNLQSLAFNYWESEEPFFFTPAFLNQLICHKPTLRKLRLNGGTLSVEQASTLCDAMSQSSSNNTSSCTTTTANTCCHLETLHIGDCRVPSNFSTWLAQGVALNQSLKCVHLDECRHLEVNEGILLGRALGRHPTLEDFQLTKSTSKTQDQSLKWAQLLKGVSSSPQLKKVKLNFSDWYDASCESFQDVVQHTPQLESLEVEGVWPQEKWLTILPTIQSSTIQSMTLIEPHVLSHSVPFDKLFPALQTAVHHCPELQKLTIRFTNCLSFPAVANFVRGLETSPNSQLRSLDLFLSATQQSQHQAGVSAKEWLEVVKETYGVSKLKVNWHSFHEYTFSGSSSLSFTTTSKSVPQQQLPVAAAAKEPADRHDSSPAGMIKGLLDMNAAGRKYIQRCDDFAGQKEQGVRVLESTIDNLSCLYFHLRENPFLCYDTTNKASCAAVLAATDDCTGRKRKRNSAACEEQEQPKRVR